MKIWMKWAGASLICVIFLILNSLIFAGNESAAVSVNRPQTITVHEKYIIHHLFFNGQVTAGAIYRIYNQPGLGEVKEVLVKPGDQVTHGQTILTYVQNSLDEELRKLTLQKEVNQVKETEYTKRAAELTQLLSQPASLNQKELEQPALEAQLTDAQVQSQIAAKSAEVLSSQIEELEKKKENLSVTSPSDGVVTSIASPQNSLSPLVTIESLNEKHVKAFVPINRALLLHEGQNVSIFLSSGVDSKVIMGTVLPIDWAMAEKKNTVPVEIRLTNPNQASVGMHIEVSAQAADSKKALTVPASSLFNEKGKTYVDTIEYGRLTKKEVIAGRKDKQEIEIVRGLKEGAVVVVHPSKMFEDGMPASPRR